MAHDAQPATVTDEQRALFDTALEHVLDALPDYIVRKLDEVPLIAEDHPAPQILDALEIHDRGRLCGLHTGIPLTDRSVQHSGTLPDVIHVFREGILNLSVDNEGYIDVAKLHHEIHVTVLHEMGHHFGLTEIELAELGYG